MKRLSFANQIAVLWGLVAAICAVLVAAVWLTANVGEDSQIAAANRQGMSACVAIASRYTLSAGSDGAANNQGAELMHAVLDVVLAQAQGVEGGFWRSPASLNPGGATASRPAVPNASLPPEAGNPVGFAAYAFPSYQGSGIKRDIPQAETPLILRTLHTVSTQHAALSDMVRNGDEAVIVSACPVQGIGGLFVWTLSRARPPLGAHGELLTVALIFVLTIILAVAIALSLALRRWRDNLSRLELSLSSNSQSVDETYPIGHVGEPDLDKIVDAFNTRAGHAAQLRRQAADLTTRLAQSERLTALGRLAAQVAHEIRNPIGAIRLKAENALAGDPERQQKALRAILEQVQRVESQVSSLLALTQPVRVAVREIDVATWFANRLDGYVDQARTKGVDLRVEAHVAEDARVDDRPRTAEFDDEQLGRAVDNLVLNALRHASRGGHVVARALHVIRSDGVWLRIEVEDDGPGVPLNEREHIFEPFVSGRPDGSGLGLAIVREVASVHGGHAFAAGTGSGACFVIEIPWRTSW
ncbi:Adaptive-response sensory-kinase SasA [Paraburkholderia domus]|uniref:sensor histidine kinase n=1 Tax=Paraburkholderia domus TaxID=2793075 RepID=UPI0019123220|nr:HAMP domain-containing sensor histidine kinase [Paraburkholderia domus]MBK5090609.1 HAMP domain-containing histidine kinase [Burkholderia sp. R-69927]CAE6909283.1 Adaptive-response sensory-kinase SasA [Paraburkholderia domus]